MDIITIKEILWDASVQVDIQGYGSCHIIDSQDFERLAQKLVKKLTIPVVSNSIAKEYAEFCVRCNRKGLPLLELEDYIEQYCC